MPQALPLPICGEGYMTRKARTMLPDLLVDPFGERSAPAALRDFELLGARFRFESNSRRLLRLVDAAFAALPRHRLSPIVPRLRLKLALRPERRPPPRSRLQPPPLAMLSGGGFLGGATERSDFVIVSPQERAGLVVLSAQMLNHPYHARYELIEFAVFTLAARVQHLVSLHAACIGRGGRGVLVMGPSGAGKSTLALLASLQGFEFVSEDSVFVTADTLLATGVANFLHVRHDSLGWVGRTREAAVIRASPIIRRRSGVRKFEVDLRQDPYRLAASPLKIGAIAFLSPQPACGGPLLRPLAKSTLRARLSEAQAYAAHQPQWLAFCRRISRLPAFEMRRGAHPQEAVDVLRSLLGP
jgi:energy-coupling factor transporter ATP-binding protein EcfA2